MKNIFLLTFIAIFSFSYSQLSIQDTICQNTSYTFPGGNTITPNTSGVYFDTLLTNLGADSIYTRLEVNASDSIFIDSYTNPTTCFSGNDGTITIGGLTPSSYDLAVNGSVSVISPTGTTFTITGLTVGTYVVGISNLNGCSSNSITQSLINSQDSIFITSVTNPTACGVANGTITIGGLTPGTTYDAPIGTIAGTTYTYSGLSAGVYNYAATPTANPACVTNVVDTSLNNTTTQIVIDSITNPSNCSACDGIIHISGLEFSATYQVNYDINGITQIPIIIASNASGISIINNLCAGTYTNITFTNPLNGCISNAVNATITQQPISSYVLNDTINSNQTYTLPSGLIVDTTGSYLDTVICDYYLINLTVIPINIPPVMLPDNQTTDEEIAVIICPIVSDVDDLISTLIVATYGAENGTVTGPDALGCFEYFPNPNFSGVDTIYTIVCDPSNSCDTAFNLVTINPVNDQPLALNDTATTLINTSINIDVAANDSDLNDPLGNIDPSTTTQVTPPLNGTINITPTTGIIQYIPDLNFLGLDSFQYVICDDGNPLPILCDTAWVYILVIDTTLSGTITTSIATPLENSKVYLIKYIASTDSVYTSDSTFTDMNGFYEFVNVSQNDYIKAVPDLVNYPSEIPTYNASAAVFQNANALNITSLNTVVNFATIAGVNIGGNGFISGIVGNGAGKNTEIGQAISGLSLILINANSEVVKQTTTNSNGEFSFDDLETAVYSIWVDKAGINNLLAPSISLNENENQTDLQFILHENFLEKITSIGIKEIVEGNISLFPNPTDGILYVKSNDYLILQLNIYNLLGEQVLIHNINEKTYQLDLKTSSLVKGTYIVQIMTKNDTYFTRLIYK